MKQNGFLILFIAIIYLIDVAHSKRLPPGIPACLPSDGVCIRNIFTAFVQNSKRYSGYNIPDFFPYRPHETWRLQSHNPSLLQLLTFTGDGSDISIDGIGNARVELVKGFGPPNTCNDNISARIYIPCLKFCSYFNAVVKLLSILPLSPFSTHGHLTAILKCTRIYLNIKSRVVWRNGEQYLQIIRTDCSFDILCDFHVDFQFETPIPVARDMVNGLVNANWQRLKNEVGPDIAKYICQIIRKFLEPIFARVPIKYFFRKPCRN